MFETWHVSKYLLTYEETIFTYTISLSVCIVTQNFFSPSIGLHKILTTLMKTFNITLIYILVYMYQSLKLSHQISET